MPPGFADCEAIRIGAHGAFTPVPPYEKPPEGQPPISAAPTTAPLSERTAIVLDAGGPGEPYDATGVQERYYPVTDVADLFYFREPWAVDGVPEPCKKSLAPLARWLAGAETAAFDPDARMQGCSGAQLTTDEYQEAFVELTQALLTSYQSVIVVGSSFGATRIRPVMEALPADVVVKLIEPGPSPLESAAAWGSTRQQVARDAIVELCASASIASEVACEIQSGLDSASPDVRFQAGLASLYLVAMADVDPPRLDEMARLSLSVDRDGDMKAPGIGFLTGMCNATWLGDDTTAQRADSVYATVLTMCEEPGAPVRALGTALQDTCLYLNDADPVSGPLAETWARDLTSSTVTRLSDPTLRHGSIAAALVTSQSLTELSC